MIIFIILTYCFSSKQANNCSSSVPETFEGNVEGWLQLQKYLSGNMMLGTNCEFWTHKNKLQYTNRFCSQKKGKPEYIQVKGTFLVSEPNFKHQQEEYNKLSWILTRQCLSQHFHYD